MVLMKRISKRKMYQKRRKTEKNEQRKNITESIPRGTPITTFYKYNNDYYTKNQYGRNITNNNPQRYCSSSVISYSQSLRLWWQTYCSAIEFHTKQQSDWHVDSQKTRLMLLKKYANDYETSSEEENDVYEESVSNETNIDVESANNCVDEEYMKFLEITHKHREELRLKKVGDNS